MDILSIGNSFSQDSHKWLKQIAGAYGDEVTLVNLMIGGCTLQRHWENYVNDAAEYSMQVNGEPIKMVTIKETLQSQKWDVITLQQASHLSGDYSSYQPYIQNLYNEVKALCPDAKIYIHQTWAYEKDAALSAFANYGNDQRVMYNALTNAYLSASKDTGCENIIPSGKVIQHLRENTAEFDYSNGGLSLNRDGFHLSLIYGRYAAALTWYATIFDKSVKEVRFIPEDSGEIADKAILQVINDAVERVMEE